MHSEVGLWHHMEGEKRKSTRFRLRGNVPMWPCEPDNSVLSLTKYSFHSKLREHQTRGQMSWAGSRYVSPSGRLSRGPSQARHGG